jgi:GTP-binding protein
MALEANHDQMEYPTLYASSRGGWAVSNHKDERSNLHPLFDAMVSHSKNQISIKISKNK